LHEILSQIDYDLFYFRRVIAASRWSSRASDCLAHIETNAAAKRPRGAVAAQLPGKVEIASSLALLAPRNDNVNFLLRDG
jgi:hypothetical protein